MAVFENKDKSIIEYIDTTIHPGGSPEVWKKRFEKIDAMYEQFLQLKKEGKLGS